MKKYVILAAAALVVASVMQYVLLYSFHPAGLVFNSIGEDEALFITSIKMAEFKYESPWTLNSDNVNSLAFLNPANGPVFMMFPLAILHSASGIDARVIFIMFKVISACLLLYALYVFVKMFEKKDGWRIFILLALSAGFGGLVHLAASVFYPERLLYPNSLFGFGVSIFRFVESYQGFSIALGIISFVFYMRKNAVLSGIFLGMTSLFYPVHGMSFFILIILHYFIFSGNAVNILKITAIAAAFMSVWAVSYFIQPLFFHNYSGTVGGVSINVLPSVIVGLGPLFILMLYDMKKRFRFFSVKKVVAFFAVSFALISYYQVSNSIWAPALPKLAEPLFMLFNVPFLVFLAYSAKNIVFSGADKKIVFMYSWFVVFLFIAMFPVKLFSLMPPKSTVFLYFPLAFIGYEGLKALPARVHAKVFLSVIAVSVISIFFFYSFEQMDARNLHENGVLRSQNFFYTESDMKAFLFLRELPPGNVLSSQEIGTYLPYYTEKKSMFFGTNRGDIVLDVDHKISDYKEFFSSPSRKILDKYGIRYVFYGEFEKRAGSIGSQDYLKKIYGGSTEIYEVIS